MDAPAMPRIQILQRASDEIPTNFLIRLARPRGVEPLTPRSVVWCSIQLSYGRLPEARGVADRAAGIKCSGRQLVQLAQDRLAHHAGTDLGRTRCHDVGGPQP